jgi:pimeloyl-ACP methyl ester carboxylesterase
VRQPARGRFSTEAPRAAREFGNFLAARRGILKSAPKGDGRPILVLPGFIGSDGSTLALRRLLRGLGYHVHAWRLGRNLGPTDRIVTGLRERVRGLVQEHRQPLTLIGHSLGGIYSREIARSAPEIVRQVITLGSPFRRPARGNSPVAPIFQALSPLHSDNVRNADPDQMSRPLPVPLTAIFTKTDGVVPWRVCIPDEAKRVEAIEVSGSHSGLIHNPAAIAVIIDRLQQKRWEPFEERPDVAATIFRA